MKRRSKGQGHPLTPAGSCDWEPRRAKGAKTHDKSTISRYSGNFSWRGVKSEAYKESGNDWDNIVRTVLAGKRPDSKSDVRYFEIAPGGNSSFERHCHEHVVIGLRGRGTVRLNRRSYRIGFLDVVYVSPNTPHQFLNPSGEPFGFICIVPTQRDRPVLIGKGRR